LAEVWFGDQLIHERTKLLYTSAAVVDLVVSLNMHTVHGLFKQLGTSLT